MIRMDEEEKYEEGKGNIENTKRCDKACFGNLFGFVTTDGLGCAPKMPFSLLTV